jgi:hypothetical protein
LSESAVYLGFASKASSVGTGSAADQDGRAHGQTSCAGARQLTGLAPAFPGVQNKAQNKDKKRSRIVWPGGSSFGRNNRPKGMMVNTAPQRSNLE